MSLSFDDEPAPPASLLEMQAFLAGAFRSARPLADRSELHDRVRSIATGNDRLSPVDQVDVYREQFWLRHVHSLGQDFPSVRHFVGGEEPFTELCRRYLEVYPPRDFMLRNLAADMARFLSTDAPYATDPLLADCARVEWVFIDAYDSPDPQPFDASALAAAGEDALLGAKLVMQSPFRLVKTRFPAHVARDAVRAGLSPPRPEPCETHLAIFRAGEKLQFFELEPAAFAVVLALLEGAPLGVACERAVEGGASEDEIGEKLGQWFQWWTQWGWLERVVLPG